MKELKDEWCGIDKNIESVVAALNVRGIRTSGSCEGHKDHGSPVSWVSISAEVDAEERGLLAKENDALRAKTQALLDEFYQNRSVVEDVKIVISNGVASFWLHNGGELFKTWRKYVDGVVENKKSGKPITLKSPQGGIEDIESRLLKFKKEFQDFAEFLKSK